MGEACAVTRSAVRTSARDLLDRAARIHDANPKLAELARAAWPSGFAGGARWMAAALAALRDGARVAPLDRPDGAWFQWLGVVKYASAVAAALAAAAGAILANQLLLLPLAVLAFYAVEVQMVFLFPLALDGSARPFRDSRAWTRRAGGTLASMLVVMRLAAHMLFGSLCGGGGALRAWCTGCLAVCIWYEDLRVPRPARERAGEASMPRDRALLARLVRTSRLEIGDRGALLTRIERVELRGGDDVSDARSASLLYASDLHLGRAWTRRIARQLVAAAQEASPDAIILGGDLVDTRKGIAALAGAVRALARVAPVLALDGNHDERVGVKRVSEAVRRASGTWLDREAIMLRPGLYLCGPDASADQADHGGSSVRVLCAHDPADAARHAGAFDVALAGHLHGGQCVLAERDGRLYPGQWVNRWTGLRFQVGRMTLIVSRGAGDTLPVRFNCPREVVLCRIRY
jgi:predicted MPP superfamily phosphohydrolase